MLASVLTMHEIVLFINVSVEIVYLLPYKITSDCKCNETLIDGLFLINIQQVWRFVLSAFTDAVDF